VKKWQDGTIALALVAASQQYTAKTQYRNKYSQERNCASTVPFPHSEVSERFIYSHDRSAYSAAGKYGDRSWEYMNRRHVNVEIGTEAARLPEKECINGIFVAVY
jgi:hypothetical protein